MWRWLLTSLAVMGFLACPHQCAAKARASLSVKDVNTSCGCCNPSGQECQSTDSSAPSHPEDCQDCICDGATVAIPTDFSVDLTSSIADVVQDHLLIAGMGNGLIGYGQTDRRAVFDESRVGWCTRIALRSLLL
jgi:hypothetical protein